MNRDVNDPDRMVTLILTPEEVAVLSRCMMVTAVFVAAGNEPPPDTTTPANAAVVCWAVGLEFKENPLLRALGPLSAALAEARA